MINEENDICTCRGEWIAHDCLKTVSICESCQNIMREAGMTDAEIEAEAKELKLVLDGWENRNIPTETGFNS